MYLWAMEMPGVMPAPVQISITEYRANINDEVQIGSVDNGRQTDGAGVEHRPSRATTTTRVRRNAIAKTR